MSDPGVPYSWRCQRKLAGSGALADLGSHLINMGRFLLGPIARVSANLQHGARATRGPPAANAAASRTRTWRRRWSNSRRA